MPSTSLGHHTSRGPTKNAPGFQFKCTLPYVTDGGLNTGPSGYRRTVYFIFLTFAAAGPFAPLTTSNSTFSPSDSDLKPSPWIEE